MRLLLTSDTQCQFSNLDYCETSLQELLGAADRYKPDVIVHGGDAKDQYDPVSTLVVKFWVRAVRRIREAGYRFIMLKGNHDRISQSVTAKDWLDILRAAGAETVSRPRIKIIDGQPLGFLPFTSDKVQEIEWSKSLLRQKKKFGRTTSVLIFHNELQGAMLNTAGLPSMGNTPEMLGMDRWTMCFGGHLHQHQAVTDNVYYIGSPFTQDWGEANSKKGHLFVEIDGNDVRMKRIITKIPHWYDTSYLEERRLLPEAGAYIRSRVPVTSKKIQDKMREEEARLRDLYGNDVRLYVIPQLEAEPEAPAALKGATDKEKIYQYVAATIPEFARFSAKKVATYLLSKLEETAPEGRGTQLRFLKVEAENVLLFPAISFSYDNQGLVLLRGRNLDWHKRSNGAGKTSALSLLPIALFGQTLKGQKADAWASERDTEAKATVKLTFRDERNQKVEVVRTRRPHSIRLNVNGGDKSVGIRGTGREETQGKIQEITGYDLRMLQNAIYIDQTVANGFVFGGEADRMSLISRFQDLERFDRAKEAVNKEITKNDQYLLTLTDREENLQEECERLEEEIKEWEGQIITQWSSEVNKLNKKMTQLLADKKELEKQAADIKAKKKQAEETETEYEEANDKLRKVNAFFDLAYKQMATHKKLVAEEKCFVCQQPAKAIGKRMLEKDQADLEKMNKMSSEYTKQVATAKAKLSELRTEISAYELEVSAVESELKISRANLANSEKGAEQELERNKNAINAKAKLEEQLQKQRRFLTACQAAMKEFDVDYELLLYAKKAFSRDGIPLYIAASLCPLLNAAADEFSELFFDGALKVQFTVDQGNFRVDVINSTGSDTLKGQSVGESAMAGVITAFSLREIAPKTNLLILDEPGHGLDAEGARLFARGLLKLKTRYDTILVTTHSPVIESVLAGETTWTVEKQNGYSQLLQD